MYVEILESREVADAVIDRFHLMDVYEDVQYRTDARKQLEEEYEGRDDRRRGGESHRLWTSTRIVRPRSPAPISKNWTSRTRRLSVGQATSKRIFLENRLKEVEAKLSKIDNILSREAKTQEMLYELLVQQYEMAKIEEAKSMPTIQVLDPPVVPELGVARGTVKKGILAGIAAFMLGVFVAFAREYVMQARRRQGEVRLVQTQAPKDSTAPAAKPV